MGGRGDSGGESGGAGIDVPSVREKLMGVSVSGLYLGPAMVKAAVPCRKSDGELNGAQCKSSAAIDGGAICNGDWRSVAKAASRRKLRRCFGAKGSTRFLCTVAARHEADEARMRRVENVAGGTRQPNNRLQ